jgi:hypothetical protein
MKDQTIKMRDGTGRTVALVVNGDSVRELVAIGYRKADAVQAVADNAFQNAIARGEIGADAWLLAKGQR